MAQGQESSLHSKTRENAGQGGESQAAVASGEPLQDPNKDLVR